jgi:hypothetical protein
MLSAPLWAAELAAAFWQAANGPEPFPRRLGDAIARSGFDLTEVELAALTTGGAARYLARVGWTWDGGAADRPLRACLVADAGGGFVFLDAADPPRERAFSRAHELAHFLRHYWQPRQWACRRLGDEAAEVLDGRRPPRPEERVRALLANVPLGRHIHLMERRSGRQARPAAVARAEAEADQLAYELLAPAAAVFARTGPVRGVCDRERLAAVLRDDFGLPAEQAAAYARLLVPPPVEDPLLGRLRR